MQVPGAHTRCRLQHGRRCGGQLPERAARRPDSDAADARRAQIDQPGASCCKQTAQLHPDRPGRGPRPTAGADVARRSTARVNALVRGAAGAGRAPGRPHPGAVAQQRGSLFESCWVAFRMGCVWVPVNHRLTPPEVAWLGASSSRRAWRCWPSRCSSITCRSREAPHPTRRCSTWSSRLATAPCRWRALTHERVAVSTASDSAERGGRRRCEAHDDPLWFFYTSGTTGKPKAGILTHGQMAFVVTNHLADLIPGDHRARLARSPWRRCRTAPACMRC